MMLVCFLFLVVLLVCGQQSGNGSPLAVQHVDPNHSQHALYSLHHHPHPHPHRPEVCLHTADELNAYIATHSEDVFPSHYYLHKLRNRMVIFIGDSLTRYQYLALIFSLKYKKYLHPSVSPSVVNEKTWTGWHDFYQRVSEDLHELCDCYRVDGGGVDFHEVGVENRRYHDAEHNITVMFFNYFGRLVHGHYLWDVLDFVPDDDIVLDILPDDSTTKGYGQTLQTIEEMKIQRMRWSNGQVRDIQTAARNQCHLLTSAHPQPQRIPVYWGYNLADFLTLLHPRVVARKQWIDAKVTLVMNAGIWGGEIKDVNFDHLVVNNARLAFDQVIWKTTTYNRCSNDTAGHEARFPQDDFICQLPGVTCLRSNWTKVIDHHNYWDCYHFNAPVYHLLNDQLVDLLVP